MSGGSREYNFISRNPSVYDSGICVDHAERRESEVAS
jgi:hypothetical protein